MLEEYFFASRLKDNVLSCGEWHQLLMSIVPKKFVIFLKVFEKYEYLINYMMLE